MLTIQMSINHFFPNQETAFNGDILWASLDHGPGRLVVVSGDDPQYISLLFTDVRLGFHEIDYGPWVTNDPVATTNGYHNYCVRM